MVEPTETDVETTNVADPSAITNVVAGPTSGDSTLAPAPDQAEPTSPAPTLPTAGPAAASPTAPAQATTNASQTENGVPVYTGPFGVAQAQRLLFRAGFGPKAGQSESLAALGLVGAVDQLLNPGPAELVGPFPAGSFLVNGDFAPTTTYGHLHLQWMDRMIRSTDSLTERMTLILHDWFALSQASVKLPLLVDHIRMLRANWRGSFRDLLQKVTVDPGMLVFLDGASNHKGAPNENYAREFMELYALGADRGAYTEQDVRELARTFTGWRNNYTPGVGFYNFRFDSTMFDSGVKTLFASTPNVRSGALTGAQGVDAVVDHPLHPSFVVSKLWSYFIPSAPSAATVSALSQLYRSSGEQLAPLVRAILLHPDLHAGPSMIKPPVVHAAACLRARGIGITTPSWIYRVSDAGQLLGSPPNVAGWNPNAWLNTATVAARWIIVSETLRPTAALQADYKGRQETPGQALAAALAVWNNPAISTDHHDLLLRLASKTWPGRVAGDVYYYNENFLANRQNVLRQLVAAGPDFQVS
jgi:hypothetical protein